MGDHGNPESPQGLHNKGRVRVHAPGTADHGRIGHVFHKFSDGRVNVTLLGRDDERRSKTLGREQYSRMLGELNGSPVDSMNSKPSNGDDVKKKAEPKKKKPSSDCNDDDASTTTDKKNGNTEKVEIDPVLKDELVRENVTGDEKRAVVQHMRDILSKRGYEHQYGKQTGHRYVKDFGGGIEHHVRLRDEGTAGDRPLQRIAWTSTLHYNRKHGPRAWAMVGRRGSMSLRHPMSHNPSEYTASLEKHLGHIEHDWVQPRTESTSVVDDELKNHVAHVERRWDDETKESSMLAWLRSAMLSENRYHRDESVVSEDDQPQRAKMGDTVHLGFGARGGLGFTGVVVKSDSKHVTIRTIDGRTIQGPHSHVSKSVEERTLTSGEESKRERIVKAMKRSASGFQRRYGDRARSVMYATATKLAKEEVEDSTKTTETDRIHAHMVAAGWKHRIDDPKRRLHALSVYTHPRHVGSAVYTLHHNIHPEYQSHRREGTWIVSPDSPAGLSGPVRAKDALQRIFDLGSLHGHGLESLKKHLPVAVARDNTKLAKEEVEDSTKATETDHIHAHMVAAGWAHHKLTRLRRQVPIAGRLVRWSASSVYTHPRHVGFAVYTQHQRARHPGVHKGSWFVYPSARAGHGLESLKKHLPGRTIQGLPVAPIGDNTKLAKEEVEDSTKATETDRIHAHMVAAGWKHHGPAGSRFHGSRHLYTHPRHTGFAVYTLHDSRYPTGSWFVASDKHGGPARSGHGLESLKKHLPVAMTGDK